MPLPSRRALHQPFFPLTSAPPPTEPPSPSSFPKYPSSTTNSPPFFPPNNSSQNAPPPPPPPSIPTFPANLSSLIPSSQNAPPSSKLLLPILLPTLALSLLLLLLSLFLLIRRRRRRRYRSSDKPDAGSDIHRLFPSNSAPSDGVKLAATSAAPSSEFLYLGTLVNSRANANAGDGEPSVGAAAVGSPELRPLPPLGRQARRSFSSDEEFYSPRDSPNGGAPLGPGREKSGSRSPVSTRSSPSYPSSRTVSSPSRSSRPPEKRSDFSGENLDSPLKIGDFPRNQFAVGPPERRAPPPPPPPPPPVAAAHWEGRDLKGFAVRPPVLVAPRLAAVFPDDLKENLDGEERQGKPKLKPLHWDKVPASSNRAMVWDHLKSSSFQLNEEMIETLFGCDSTKAASKVNVRRLAMPIAVQENMVLDPKKAQNVAILLRALNVTKEEVCEALLEGNADSLGNELLDTLLKMAPSKEEEIKLKEYKDDSPFKLGAAEKFLKAMLDIPFAFKRADAMLYIANFDSEISYLKKSFETLELACEELRNSRLFRKLLDAVLKTGNRMNVGTNRGDAQAFKLDTLLKLVDVKGTDGKTSLLHFVVQEISRAEGSRLVTANPSAIKPQINTLQDDLECKRLGLQVVSGLGAELTNVKKAATMDSEVLSSYVSKLTRGIEKIKEVLRLNEALNMVESNQRFHEAMSGFLRMAAAEIAKLQAQESVTLSLVKEITGYFHGDSAREEAHPFRIFMVVKDFLAVLDQVCKEVGRINERTAVSSARRSPVPASPGLTPIFPRIRVVRPGSSDDETSSSSSLSS